MTQSPSNNKNKINYLKQVLLQLLILLIKSYNSTMVIFFNFSIQFDRYLSFFFADYMKYLIKTHSLKSYFHIYAKIMYF